MSAALWVGRFVLMTAPLLTGLQAQQRLAEIQEYPTPVVRERQRVVIRGVSEIWELRWKSQPKPACEPSDVSLTCPCTGFAYGEGGDLDLARFRNGEEVESLNLTPFFKGADVNLGDVAILQRWEPNYKTDFKGFLADGDFAGVVARRNSVQIMRFADYDHDGEKSEFFLQVDTRPCGKRVGVVIGVSDASSKLHAFATAAKPSEPLVLQDHIWDALMRSREAVEVVDWFCGDHGADAETTVRLQNTPKGIVGVRRTFACPHVRGQRPITEEPL